MNTGEHQAAMDLARERCAALCHTVQRSVGELRSRTPRMRALAARVEDVAPEVAQELREHADRLDTVRRALTSKADATLSDTQPIDEADLPDPAG